MSCFERFRCQAQLAEEQKFTEKAVEEIQQRKKQLKRQLRNSQVKGDFHKATQIQAKLEKLDKIKERMTELLDKKEET